MSSERIKRRTKSKFTVWAELKKNKGTRCKGVSFYNSSYRKALKKILDNEVNANDN